MDLKECGLLFLLLLPLSFVQDKAAGKTDEQIIRDLIEQENAGKIKIPLTPNYILVSGINPRPVVGVVQDQAKKKRETSLETGTKNKKTVLRLTVSNAGDIANEFGVYTNTPALGNRTAPGSSYLRTWKKVNGSWMIDIMFTGFTRGINKKAE